MAERPYSELLLLRIPVGMRADFDRYFEEQLAADRARNADPDPFALKQQTINRLIAEAEGTTTADGRGFVPFYDGEYKGYHLRPPRDGDRLVPNAWGTLRTRAVQAPQSPWVRIGLVIVAGLLAVWLSAAWSLRNTPALVVAKPTPTVAPTPTTPPALATADPGMLAAAAAAISGESLTPNLQAPSSLEVVRGSKSLALYRVEASATQADGTWKPKLTRGVAAWVKGTVVNVAFCVPQDAPAVQEGDQVVVRLRSGEARAYTVHTARDVPQQAAEVFAQRRAGMTVVVCSGGATRRIWEGRFDASVLDDTTPPPTVGPRDLELQVVAAYPLRQPDGTRLLAIGLRITNPTDRRVDVQDAVTVHDAAGGGELPVLHPLAVKLPAKGTLDHVLTLRAPMGMQVYVRSAGPFGARAWHIQLEGDTP